MNHNNGWMDGWSNWGNGGTWVWPVIATLVVVLLVVAIVKLAKK